MIEEVYPLADLQATPFGVNSRIYSSDVYSLVGSKKRKRSEVVLARDSQDISIYDVCENYLPSTRVY